MTHRRPHPSSRDATPCQPRPAWFSAATGPQPQPSFIEVFAEAALGDGDGGGRNEKFLEPTPVVKLDAADVGG
jgi:hypothetical protein